MHMTGRMRIKIKPFSPVSCNSGALCYFVIRYVDIFKDLVRSPSRLTVYAGLRSFANTKKTWKVEKLCDG